MKTLPSPLPYQGHTLPAESEFGQAAWFFRDEQIARNRFEAIRVPSKTAPQWARQGMTRAEGSTHAQGAATLVREAL